MKDIKDYFSFIKVYFHKNYTVWGSHLGSETLLRRHKNTRTRIACITVLEKRRNEIELRKTSEKPELTMESLPEECVREILCKLSDHRDVDNAGRTTPTMSYIVAEKRIWRELVQAHFTASQVQFIFNKKPE